MEAINHEGKPVVIIGAGPAGLTAGYELSKLGGNSIILEADDLVGGISRTVNYQGYRFDIGGHRFFSKIPYINQLWEEILTDDFLVRPRLSRIHYRGHFFDYPLKATNALSGLGPLEAMRIGISYSKAKFFPSKDEENFEQWVSNRFGRRLYGIFFKTYTEKVWGIPCSEISADWAAQRIKNLSLKEALYNALFSSNGKDKDGKVITTLIEQFHYPRLGPGMMWECCQEFLADRQTPTIFGERATRIRHKNRKIECIYTENHRGEKNEYSGSHYISSMPLKELVLGLDPMPPDHIVAAANNLRYRDYLTVVLIINRDDVFPDNWIYIHTPEVKLGRIQNYKNWSPEMVPDMSKSSLGLEYFLWESDEEWRWPDERLIETGIRECVQIGLIDPKEVLDGTVVRMKKAYPVYDQNYHNSVAVLQEYICGFKNLQTIGRNGLHRYNNQDHSMMTGVYAARNLNGEAHDVWAVNTEQEYHEEGELAKKNGAMGDRLVPTRLQPEDSGKKDYDAVVKTTYQDQVIDEAFAWLDPLALGTAIGIVCAAVLFLASSLLILKGGSTIGPTLSLMSNYLPGFSVTWPGAAIGALQVGIGGFLLGNIIARLRNWSVVTYANWVRRRTEAKENKDLLDKV